MQRCAACTGCGGFGRTLPRRRNITPRPYEFLAGVSFMGTGYAGLSPGKCAFACRGRAVALAFTGQSASARSMVGGGNLRLHPIETESVAPITNGKTCCQPSSIFPPRWLTCGLWRGRRVGKSDQTRWPWYFVSLVLFVFALLSKTVTCTLPAALLLVAWWNPGRIKWRDVLPLLPFFAIGLASVRRRPGSNDTTSTRKARSGHSLLLNAF